MVYEECLKHVHMNVTEEIKKFVRDEVFGNSEYLFVTKSGSNKRGYCSKCSREYYVENAHHNGSGICPECGASLTVKLSRYGKKNCNPDKDVEIFIKAFKNEKLDKEKSKIAKTA